MQLEREKKRGTPGGGCTLSDTVPSNPLLTPDSSAHSRTKALAGAAPTPGKLLGKLVPQVCLDLCGPLPPRRPIWRDFWLVCSTSCRSAPRLCSASVLVSPCAKWKNQIRALAHTPGSQGDLGSPRSSCQHAGMPPRPLPSEKGGDYLAKHKKRGEQELCQQLRRQQFLSAMPSSIPGGRVVISSLDSGEEGLPQHPRGPQRQSPTSPSGDQYKMLS